MGTAFLIMFLSGFWLNRTGKPYGTLIFTIHKLTGIGIGVLLFITVRQVHQITALNMVESIIVAVATLFFMATVTTGSLLSIPFSKPMPQVVSALNKVFPYFTVISAVMALYFLLARK
jgi:hypothetical protein